MSLTYSGRCIGGPYDGRLTTHSALRLYVVINENPVLMIKLGLDPDAEVAVQYGHYHWDEVDEVWRWQT